MMGGEINWSALPVVVEVLGILDVEKLIMQLSVIKERKRSRA